MTKIFLLLSIVFVNGEEIKHFNLNMPMQTQQTCQEELDKMAAASDRIEMLDVHFS